MINADNNDINVQRRPIRLNTMRRRHEGLSPLEIDTIQTGYALLVHILQLTVIVPFGLVRNTLLGAATALIASIQAAMEIAYRRLDIVDASNKVLNNISRLLDTYL